MSKDNEQDQKEKPGKMKRKEFEKELEKLQVELVKLQRWVVHEGLRVIIVFEGRDAAGKGGTIKRIVDRVSPRVFRIVALPTPTEREKSEMYIQRYMAHFPAAGRSHHFRPQLVQSGWCRACDGLLHRPAIRGIPQEYSHC